MFDKATGGFRHKNEMAVELRLAGQAPETAFLFHVNGERLTDLLNDPRAFIPVRRAAGDIMIVAKTQIAAIVECGGDEPEAVGEKPAKAAPKNFDPYEVLRVSRDATAKELRAAFRARIKAVHPDAIASLGLDEDLAKAALQATQKIIYAYKKIMRERGAADDVAEEAAQAAR